MSKLKFCVYLAVLLLTACAQKLPHLDNIRVMQSSTLKASGKAIVVFSGSFAITGVLGPTDSDVELTFAKPGGSIVESMMAGAMSDRGDNRERPTVKQVEAGRLNLTSFMLMVGGKPQIQNNNAAFTGVPLADITVSPGEVVYIGHVLVRGEDRAMMIGTPRSFSLTLEDHGTKARSYLQSLSPTLAEQMSTRLMTVNPIFLTKAANRS
jgi:hypothetical protein